MKFLVRSFQEKDAKKTRNVKNPTKKCGCPAKINIKQVIKFPEFKVIIKLYCADHDYCWSKGLECTTGKPNGFSTLYHQLSPQTIFHNW